MVTLLIIQEIKILVEMDLYQIPQVLKKVILKYQQLAKDAQSNGDPVLIENYLQHAEHYSRKLAEINFKNQPALDKSIKSEETNSNPNNTIDKEI